MSNIYIIAGPPGVGKSTIGDQFIGKDLDILNEDEMRFRYKAKGYADYNEYSIHRVRDTIRMKLIRNEDFALELNLGYAHQYDYAISAKKFSTENKLNVVLLFTDDLEMCIDRAKIRYESGRHLVQPETIREMYQNTIPLLKTNFQFIDHLLLIDIDHNTVNRIADFNKANQLLTIHTEASDWFKTEVKPFIEKQQSLKSFSSPALKPLKPGNPGRDQGPAR